MCDTTVVDKMYHDASPTWSGFNYQGKTALYAALDYLNSLGTKDPNDFILELEWLEDFSIKDKDNNYISIHQVKAYSNDDLYEYADAIYKLFQKVATGRVEQAFIHTWKDISLRGKTWHDGIKNLLLEKIDGGNSTINALNEILINDNKVLQVISNFNVPKRGRPSDIDKILKEYMREYLFKNPGHHEFPKDIVIMKRIIQHIMSVYPNEAATYKSIITSRDEILQKINKYSYSDGNLFCSIENIEVLIQNQIKMYYQKYNKPQANDNIHIQRVYLHMLAQIDKHITDRHLTYRNKVKGHLEFSDLIHILEKPLSDNSPEYYSYHLRNELNLYKEQYCNGCIDEISINSECQGCNLVKAINEINSLDEPSFMKLCKNVNPNVVADFIDITNFRKFLPEPGTKRSIFESLCRIERNFKIDKNKIEYVLQDNIVSLLTAIVFADGTRFRETEKIRIADAVLVNMEMEEALREVDVMISYDVNIPTLAYISSNVSNIQQECVEVFNANEQEFNHITKQKKVSIKPIDDVLRELI